MAAEGRLYCEFYYLYIYKIGWPGKGCWKKCGRKSGPCKVCSGGKYCCKKGLAENGCNGHCATKSSLRISKIPTETRPLSPCSGRSTGSEKPKNSGFLGWPPELHQGEGRGHLQPQGGHLEQSYIKAGGNKKL